MFTIHAEPPGTSSEGQDDIFEDFRKALGYSVLNEELRGNYRKARNIAERLRSHAINAAAAPSGSAESNILLADASLALGIVMTLQGNPGAAIKVLREAEKQSWDDERRKVRAILWRELALLDTLCTYPGRVSVPVESENMDVTITWKRVVKDKYADRVKNSCNLFKTHQGALGDALDTELSLFLNFHLPTRISRSLGRKGPEWQNARNTAIAYFNKPQKLLANKIPRYDVVLELNKADICHRCGLTEGFGNALSKVEALSQLTSHSNIGVAKMMLGDSRVACSGSILLWNSMVDRTNPLGVPCSTEFKCGALDRTSSELYNDAYQIFDRAGCARGKAHILVRKSFLECSKALLQGNSAASTSHYIQCLNLLGRAETLFDECGDFYGIKVVEMHSIIAGIGSNDGISDSVRTKAKSIGTWGARDGSFSFALSIADTLLSVGGSFYFLQRERLVAAASCVDIAEIIYQGLNANWGVLVCKHKRCEILFTAGATPNIAIESRTAISQCSELINLYAPGGKLFVSRTLDTIQLLFSQGMKIRDPSESTKHFEGLGALLSAIKVSLLGKMLGATFTTPGAEKWLDVKINNRMSYLKHFLPVLVALRKSEIIKYKCKMLSSERLQTEYDELINSATERAQAAPGALANYLLAIVNESRGMIEEAIERAKMYNKDKDMENLLAAHSNEPAVVSHLKMIETQDRRRVAFLLFVRLESFTEARKHFDWLNMNIGEDWWKMEDTIKNRTMIGRLIEGEGDFCPSAERERKYREACDIYNECIQKSERLLESLTHHETILLLSGDVDVQEASAYRARTLLKLAKLDSFGSDSRERHAEFFSCMEAVRARSLSRRLHDEQILKGIDREDFPKEKIKELWRLAAEESTWAKIRHSIGESQGVQPNPAGEEQNLRVELQKSHDIARSTRQKLESSLLETYSHDKVFREFANGAQVGLMTLNDIMGALPSDSAMVQIFSFKNDMFVWGITKDGITQVEYRRISSSEVNEAVSLFVNECSKKQPNRKLKSSLGATLASWLLNPCKATIAKAERLIIVPHMESMTLPFCALPWDDEREPLGVQKRISYLPCASTLQYCSSLVIDQPIRFDDALLVGCNYVGDKREVGLEKPSGGFPELELAEAEAREIARKIQEKLYSDVNLQHANVTLLCDEYATTANVRKNLSERRIIHFATHGLLNKRAALNSYVALAGQDFVKALDLLNWRIEADLVVLSACKTALGEATSSGDLLGLVRAFLIAGARRVLAPLWAVNDSTSKLFMLHFYKELLEGREPDLAVQRAATVVREKYPQEKYWAAYMLVG